MPRRPSVASSRTVLNDLPFSLARASLSFRRFNEQTLRAVGLDSLPTGLASVLHSLNEQDGCTVMQLAARAQLPKGTLTGLLDELEERHLVTRLRNPEDGRSWLVALTLAGKRHCALLTKRHALVDAILGARLSREEQAELVRLLTRVTDEMRRFLGDEVTAEEWDEPDSDRGRASLSRTSKRQGRSGKKVIPPLS